MQAIRSLNGDILGYSLPPELERLQKLAKQTTLGNKALGFILPPEFQKMKELVELQNLRGQRLGYILPPDNVLKVLSQFEQIFQYKNTDHLIKALNAIQQVIAISKKAIEQESCDHDFYQEIENIEFNSADIDFSENPNLISYFIEKLIEFTAFAIHHKKKGLVIVLGYILSSFGDYVANQVWDTVLSDNAQERILQNQDKILKNQERLEQLFQHLKNQKCELKENNLQEKENFNHLI